MHRMDRLSLFQTVAHWLAPTRIYDRPPAVARRNQGFRQISVSREIVHDAPSAGASASRTCRIPGKGSARQWNSIGTGEPVTDEKHLDWLERIWLAAIGVEPAPDLGMDRRQIAVPDPDRS